MPKDKHHSQKRLTDGGGAPSNVRKKHNNGSRQSSKNNQPSVSGTNQATPHHIRKSGAAARVVAAAPAAAASASAHPRNLVTQSRHSNRDSFSQSTESSFDNHLAYIQNRRGRKQDKQEEGSDKSCSSSTSSSCSSSNPENSAAGEDLLVPVEKDPFEGMEEDEKIKALKEKKMLVRVRLFLQPLTSTTRNPKFVSEVSVGGMNGIVLDDWSTDHRITSFTEKINAIVSEVTEYKIGKKLSMEDYSTALFARAKRLDDFNDESKFSTRSESSRLSNKVQPLARTWQLQKALLQVGHLVEFKSNIGTRSKKPGWLLDVAVMVEKKPTHKHRSQSTKSKETNKQTAASDIKVDLLPLVYKQGTDDDATVGSSRALGSVKSSN
jgi:hypothetical protein